MNTEFKKFFGFSKLFETQKISNDYSKTKYFRMSSYNSFIIFSLLGIFLVKFSIFIFFNKEIYMNNFLLKKKLIHCKIMFH